MFLGSQLLVGGNFISLWTSGRKKQDSRTGSPVKQGSPGRQASPEGGRIRQASPEGGRARLGSPEVGVGGLRPDTIHVIGTDEIDTDTDWNESWSVTVASPVIHLKFSPDGSMFASASMVSSVYVHSSPVSLIV